MWTMVMALVMRALRMESEIWSPSCLGEGLIGPRKYEKIYVKLLHSL